MNKEMKDNLGKVINSLVNDDSKTATDALHEYLRAKAQTIILGEDEDMDDMDDKPAVDDESDDEKKMDADHDDDDSELDDGDDGKVGEEDADAEEDDMSNEEEEKSKKAKAKK
jgi:hypothetical protein